MNRTALLIGGLGLGAGLIYMLDPERGERRRAMARAQLERYRRQTDDLWDHTTRSLSRQAREFLARAPLARRYRRPGPGELLLARVEQLGLLKGMLILGCMGLGASMMYALDPGLGRRRRALVRDKAQAYWRRTGKFISQTARDARQRTYGLIAETQTQLREADVPEDTVLVARVRAQIGHVVSQAGAVDVTAHQGRVTLSGSIAAHEVEKLLSAVASVAGVTAVVNRLEVNQATASGAGGRGNPGTREGDGWGERL
jgi:osmotically-inducible protein OsmY